MATNPNTKILPEDLNKNLKAIYDALKKFQGDESIFPTLYDRLTHLDNTDFTGDTKKVIQDLIDGENNDSKGTAIERIRKLEQKGINQQDIKVEGTFHEQFSYDADGDIIKHVATGEQEFSTDYIYNTINNEKVMTDSVEKFKNSKGQNVIVTKKYSYDSSLNIIDIVTTTTIDETAPASITRLSYVENSSNPNILTLSYSLPTDTDFKGINIYVNTLEGKTLKFYKLVSTPSYTVDIPSDGSIVCIIIKSVDDSNNETTNAPVIVYRTEFTDLVNHTYVAPQGKITTEADMKTEAEKLKV